MSEYIKHTPVPNSEVITQLLALVRSNAPTSEGLNETDIAIIGHIADTYLQGADTKDRVGFIKKLMKTNGIKATDLR